MMSTSRKAVLAVFVVVCTILTEVNGKPPKQILGGEDAVLGDHPWIVAIGTRHAVPLCGGAIISPRHILTAGHCVADLEPSHLIVRSGFVDIYDRSAIVRVVKDYIVHPDYRPQTKTEDVQNDIAILELKRDLPVGKHFTKTIPLASKQPGDQYGVFAGWGDLSSLKDSPITLQTAVVRMQNAEDCAEENWDLDLPKFLCGYIKSGSTLSGDSGSPLTSNGELVGVLSSSVGDPDKLNVFTNVYFYRDWIKSVIG